MTFVGVQVLIGAAVKYLAIFLMCSFALNIFRKDKTKESIATWAHDNGVHVITARKTRYPRAFQCFPWSLSQAFFCVTLESKLNGGQSTVILKVGGLLFGRKTLMAVACTDYW